MGRIVSMLAITFIMAFPLSLNAAGKERPMRIWSPAFSENAKIPARYTCDGQDKSPPLNVEDVPSNTRSFALIVDDPDAPAGVWVHWIVWNIDGSTREIAAGSLPKGALQGINDFKENGYGGPCPPSGTHRYFFKLYALDTLLDLPKKAAKADLEQAMKAHIVGRAETIGRYR